MSWMMLLKEIMSFCTFLSVRRKINILSEMQPDAFLTGGQTVELSFMYVQKMM